MADAGTVNASEVICLPGQLRLLASVYAHVLFVAGIASGKTAGGARWVLARLCQQPAVVGFIGAQTHGQLTHATLPPLLSLLSEVGLEWRLGKAPPAAWGPTRFPDHTGILSVRIPGSARPAQVITGSLNNYDAHRGISVGWYWLDEARDMEEAAYDVILGRLRGQPAGTQYGGILTTTPNGFGWLHKRFVAEPGAGTGIVRAATTENIYLHPTYVSGLRAMFSERYAKQELDGEFLNMTSGQAYYAFRRETHIAPCVVDPTQPMWFAMDFNVSPLCAIYGQSDKQRARVTGEVYIQGSARTADAVEEFVSRHVAHTRKEVTIFGDRSGANRDTRSDRTDYDIIEQTFQGRGWRTTLKRNHTNPRLVESVETINAILERRAILVDASAKHLISDLEQVSWQEGTRILDKSNPGLTHCSDALRYFLYMEFPMPSQRATTADWL